jgi:hypothetical protein
VTAATTTVPPASGAVVLPELDWTPTAACGSRDGVKVARVVVHRWGVRFTSEAAEAASYHGVVRFFEDPKNEASAHIVFPGSAVPGHATQMVAWDQKAWAEAAYNPTSDDVESADAIWLGHDWQGFHVLSRIVAYRLHQRGLPAVWSAERGFCRHGDLGEQGGGHTACPTTDPHLWRLFAAAVQHEHARGGFRRTWGR